MRKKGIKARKALALLILALAAVDFTTPVMAMDTVTSGKVLDQVNGKYGADLRDVTGATVRTDYTNAYIENTQTNSILNWDRLNTAPRQSLNYIMKDGQTSLNNVVGVGLSQFAGAINAEHGRVIISNPNGILFENGSLETANGKDVNIDTKKDVKLAGANIGGNLNITRAGNVVISNSKETGNQYIPSLATKDSVTDYDNTKYNESYFTDIINDFGSDYGKGTKLSVIKGDVNISNSKNSLIINTIVGGNLTTKNIYVGSDLINSMVVGDYNPNRIATTDTKVYKSFIGGKFDKKFEDNPTILPITDPERPVVVDNPTILPITDPERPVVVDNPTILPDTGENNPVVVTPPQPEVNPNRPNENTGSSNISNNENNNRISSSQVDDHNKRKFGNDINTRFQKRFSPRGFAAEEDQINEMKSQTKSSIVKTEGNKVKFTKSFHAY